MDSPASLGNKWTFQVNAQNFGSQAGIFRCSCERMYWAIPSRLAARFIDGSGDGCREDRRGAVARNGGGDAVERGGRRFHHVMAAGAVDMDVNKAGNDGHAGGDVVSGALRDFHLVAMADCGDAAAFDDDNGVERALPAE